MLIRCNKESQHLAVGPKPPVEQPQRTRKTQRDSHNSGVKILQFMFGLQLPLTCNPWTTLSNPFNKVRGKILLKKSSCVFPPACVFVTASVLLLCRCDDVDDYITNVEILKRIVSEKKTILPTLRNHNWKTVKAKTEKLSESLTQMSTSNIKEFNEVIYAGARLFRAEIGFSLQNTNRNSKCGWEIRLKTLIRDLRQQVKTIRQRKNSRIC